MVLVVESEVSLSESEVRRSLLYQLWLSESEGSLLESELLFRFLELLRSEFSERSLFLGLW